MKLSLAERPDVPRRLAGRMPKASPRVVAGALIAGVLATSGVAYAEGGFSSSISNAANGFTTRTWTDKALDGASTTTYLSGCSSPYANNWYLDVELRKSVFGPDKSYGSKSFTGCKSYGVTQSWGNPGSGTFFNQLHMYDYDKTSASTYNVRY